ncbi:hypothetical protein CWR48_18200 [Oceanobacillus arenosus]|uniref:Site-specific integrase n=1 Tax=Oceanobacillus arenosus TaxID=1229153 RepID=A0A3D8PLK2_9BACI|nr:hypothetical protein [Oceanobacillus arenosus]RDW16118.1 hypothetical protein CWR48_18200 [Oceanobacillus arenosus]
MQTENYKWIVREDNIEHLLSNNQLEHRTVVTICVKDLKTNLIVPHPITHFIKAKYEFKGKSLSSQLNPARELVKFLNFINEQLTAENPEFQCLQKKGFRGLTFLHGARYITYCTEKRFTVKNCEEERRLSYKYVRGHIERYLVHFYDYLEAMDIIDEEIELDRYFDRRNEEIIISPFTEPIYDTHYPSIDDGGLIRNKLKDFGDNDPNKRNKMVYEFLEEARRVSSDIAFGIALQIFAGLRRGEVVNLTATSIPTNFLDGSNYIAVYDNQQRLFKHLKNTIKEQVKRPRIQPVLPSTYLKEIYDAHMKMNEKVKKENTFAFFVDENGHTISGGMYERKFAKVKYAYIDRLAKTPGRYSDFHTLETTVWGTHIGRGIFTAYLFDRVQDDRQMAIARGDISTESAKSYIDYRNAISNFQMAMEIMSSEDLVELNNIEKAINENWDWEVFRNDFND